MSDAPEETGTAVPVEVGGNTMISGVISEPAVPSA